jgi:hypothetical protein
MLSLTVLLALKGTALSAPVPDPRPAQAQEPAEDHRWEYAETTDHITGKKTVRALFRTGFLRIPQRGQPQPGRPGSLDFRCNDRSTSVTLWMPGELMAGSSATVVYRIDERPPVTVRNWTSSTDYTAIGLWDTRRAAPFAKSLIGAKQLAIRVHDTVFGTTEATIDLTNIGHRIRNVRAACRW